MGLFFNLCEDIILMKSLSGTYFGLEMVTVPQILHLVKTEEFLPYFSVCIFLSRTREVQQDWKVPSCLGHSGPGVSLRLAVGCRFTPFVINFSDIIYWWHRTPELWLPSLVVANCNSSKKSTNVN